jgi:hypothetical protein
VKREIVKTTTSCKQANTVEGGPENALEFRIKELRTFPLRLGALSTRQPVNLSTDPFIFAADYE